MSFLNKDNIYSFFNYIADLNRSKKIIILIFFDFLCLFLSTILTLLIFKNYADLNNIFFYVYFVINFILLVLIFYILGIYNNLVRYVGLKFILDIFFSIILHSFVIVIILIIFDKLLLFSLINSLSLFIFILMSRISINIIVNELLNKNKKKKIIIYGAGEAGYLVSQKLKNFIINCFVDDDINKINNKINNILVLSSKNLGEIIKKNNIQLILIAIPSLDSYQRNKILDKCQKFNVQIKILPKLNDFLTQEFKIDNYDFISSDFVDRKIDWNQEKIKNSINNKNILITGGGGSIGSELTRQIFFLNPSSIIVLDNNEYNLFQIKNELTKYSEIDEKLKSVKTYFNLLDVSNLSLVKKIFKNKKIDIIFHAAAYKHVGLLETNEKFAFKNNVSSTFNLAELAYKHKILKFINISTDKAVKPTNIMGLTKFFAENIIYSISQTLQNECIFSSVRFGNVINSKGSIIPIFKKQIENGGPVTVTDKNVTRYFMSIPEAVGLVLETNTFSSNGDVFFLDMGKPIKILDIAKKMIRLNGLDYTFDQNDKSKILITFTGLRSGEKLHEDLTYENNYLKTINKFIFKDLNKKYLDIDKEKLRLKIDEIQESNSNKVVRNFLNNLSEYN